MQKQLQETFKDGVPRDWRKRAKAFGITDRQHLWDLLNPNKINCVKCGKVCPVRKTNIGRLETCGDDVCRKSVKREKTKSTSLEKYGVDHPSKAQVTKSKAINTCIDRYGGHPLANPTIAAKRRQTNLDRYGNACPAVSESLRHISRINKWKNDEHRFQTVLLPAFSKRAYERFGIEVISASPSLPRKFSFSHDCGAKWEAECSDRTPRCPTCGSSKEEQFIQNMIKSFGFSFQSRNRKLIHPLELDVVIPEKKLAIEINGCYWHEDGMSTPLAVKTRKCDESGIRLVQIMDWECNERPDLVRSHLAHSLGITASRIMARNCSIDSVSAVEARMFLDEHHLSGFHKAKQHLALRYSGKIVAVLSVGKPRWGKCDLEIIRWATLKDTVIQGGFSKCLKRVIADHSPRTILSFCDLRWGTGKVYEKFGFVNTGTTPPNYWWCKGKKRLSRYQTQKHMLSKVLPNYDATISEADNMHLAGWWKVSDCGNQRWVFTVQ